LAVRVALDTNRYDDLIVGDEAVADIVESAETVFLPFVVIGELRAGFAAGTRKAEKDGVEILWAGEQTCHHYASVYAQLRRQGTPIPTNDMWIAALVLEHELALCSRDVHFDKLAQIVRV
jgi:tRNA(fMet)-specific endonuclease VapC